jgi:hypothetical protein
VKPFQRIALVAGGFVVCLLLASAAVAIRILGTAGLARQSASGMYGFGDTILFVAVFGVCALMPTGAALYFLRPNRRFWTVLSASSLVIAATGVAAGILFTFGRGEPASRLATWAAYSILRILVSPLLALTFLVCAGFSPHRTPRIAFLIAVVAEVAVCAVWFAFLLLHRS